MHNRISIFTVCVLGSFLFLSCTRENSSPPLRDISGLTVTLGDTVETHVLRDDLHPLSSLSRISQLRDDAFIAQAPRAPLALFENYEMTRMYGAHGKGPCEYTVANSFDFSGDSLFVLSTTESKIITYRISTGECLNELNAGSLVENSYLARDGNDFIIGRFSYYAGTPDSTVLLHRMDDSGGKQPLSLRLGMLDPVPVAISMSAFALDFAQSSDRIYAYFRYTDYMTHYEKGIGEVHTFPLGLYLAREKLENKELEFSQAFEIMQREVEQVVRIYASDEWVATSVVINNNEGDPRWLEFYSPSGEHLGRVPLERLQPVGYHNGRFIFSEQIEDRQSEYAIRLIYREVILE